MTDQIEERTSRHVVVQYEMFHFKDFIDVHLMKSQQNLFCQISLEISGKQYRGSVDQGAGNRRECFIRNINGSIVSELVKLCQYLVHLVGKFLIYICQLEQPHGNLA